MSLPLHGRPCAEPPQAGLNGYPDCSDSRGSMFEREH